jgi:hypothetical protein
MATSHADANGNGATASNPPTSPATNMNGHFASVGGDAQTDDHYEHGIQVIDEEKEFKCVERDESMAFFADQSLAVPISTRISNLPKLPSLASTTTLYRSSVPSRLENQPCLITCLAHSLVLCRKTSGGRLRRGYGCPRTSVAA